MKLLRRPGSTSHIFQVFIQDSSSTTGAGLTGLTSASAGLTAYYHRNTDTTATAISLVTMTVGTFTSGGFKEIDAVHMAGWYQFCPPDAALASGATSVGFHLSGATNMAPLPIEVDMDGQVDVYLWNGTAVAAPATAGIPDVNAKNINNVATTFVTTINPNIGTTQPQNFTGTGASALVQVDTRDFLGQAVQLDVNNLPKVDVEDWKASAVNALVSGNVQGAPGVIRTSTTQAGSTSTTIVLDASASATTDFYKDCLIWDVTTGQSRLCTAYNGTTKTATVTPAWQTTPGTGDTFAVLVDGESDLGLWAGSAPNALVSGRVDASLGANNAGNLTADVQTIKTQTVTCSAGVTVNPNVGTTQPVNFTGTAGSALVKSDMVDIAGAAVSTSTAQIGVNVIQAAGTTWRNSDGTLASATASTVTFPTTDSAGNAIPDDNRFAFNVLEIVAGTGIGQTPVLTTKSGVRTFNILSGTCPVTLDATSQYVVITNNSQIEVIRTGTAQAGGASTITLDAGASATNNFYQNQVVFILSGTGAGQSALVTTYVGTTKVATINGTWATNPDSTSVFALLPFGAISASVAGNVTVGGYAAGQDPGTYVLATPSQKLVTNASGFVTFSNTTIATVTNLTNLPSIPTNWLTAAGIAAGALNGKGDWLLASSAPTNFGSLAITVGGAVTAGTVSDKTGYSLTQAFPSNFAALSIDANGRVELQSGITKNAALNNFEFLLVSSTDHVTPVTGATVTATRSLDGAAFGACVNAVTEVGSGIYKINLAATDTNAGIVTLKMSATGADTRYITLVTTP